MLPEETRKSKLILTAVLIVVGIGLQACGIASRTAPGTYGESSADSPVSLNHVQEQLHEAHREWKGTPYVLGGRGINGVDCSSFIQIVFDEHFGLDLPRSTREQMQVGKGIRRSFIRPGDLIFFKTSRNSFHVGIAMEGERFLHASTSNGVMISSLSERYWGTRYLGARRVF